MTWERGRTEVERLIREGGLERVEPSSDMAARLIAESEAHLRLSKKGVDDDPAGALQLAYDAARAKHALRSWRYKDSELRRRVGTGPCWTPRSFSSMIVVGLPCSAVSIDCVEDGTPASIHPLIRRR